MRKFTILKDRLRLIVSKSTMVLRKYFSNTASVLELHPYVAYLEGCRNLISHVPSGETVTSFAITSISFAAASPSRFERMARMSGAMPLVNVG